MNHDPEAEMTFPMTAPPEHRVGVLRSWAALGVLLGLATVAACERMSPTDVGSIPDPIEEIIERAPIAPAEFGEVECVADVRSGVVTCALPGQTPSEEEGGPARVVLSRQGTDVQLASSNASFNGTTFFVDVTVKNLIGQAIGTVNGTTPHADGVRVFFSSNPIATSGDGSVAVANANGTANFTAPLQSYHQYNQLLEPDSVSSAKTWEFDITGTVNVFQFRVMVSAPVQFPDGWVEVSPATANLLPGGVQALSAQAYDALGEPVARTFTWSSTVESVATVVSGTGVVTAHEEGWTTITAVSDDEEQVTGTATISVAWLTLGPGDDFAGPLNEAIWDVAGGSYSVDNRLQIGVPETGSTVVSHTGIHNFVGRSFFAEVSQFAAGGGSAYTFIRVATVDGNTAVALAAVGGNLIAYRQWDDPNPTAVGTPVQLDPGLHRFLRIREAGGTVSFETSATGASWSPFASVVHQFGDGLSAVRGSVGVVRTGEPGDGPVPALFENVNSLVPAAPRELTATVSGEPNAIDLAWQVLSVNETGFAIERRIEGNGAFAQIATVGIAETGYEDFEITENTTYEYRVRAYGPGGESAYTNVATVTAAEPPPLFHTLVDHFTGTELNAANWRTRNYLYTDLLNTEAPARAGLVTVDGGRVAIRVDPAPFEHTTILYQMPHRFTGSSFSAEISQIATALPVTPDSLFYNYIETVLAVTEVDQSEIVFMTIHGGILEAWSAIDATYIRADRVAAGSDQIPYDPVNHRHLRLRESDGTIYYETSDDGSDWTIQWSAHFSFTNPDDLRGEVGTGTWDWGNPNPEETFPTLVESVNVPGPAPSGSEGSSVPAAAGQAAEGGTRDRPASSAPNLNHWANFPR